MIRAALRKCTDSWASGVGRGGGEVVTGGSCQFPIVKTLEIYFLKCVANESIYKVIFSIKRFVYWLVLWTDVLINNNCTVTAN